MTAPETTVHALPPLLRLPDELLAKLALLVIADDRRSVMKITAVCRYLRVVYIDTSELWTDIDSSWPSELRQLFLRRAGSQPLALQLGSFSIDETIMQCLSQASEIRIKTVAEGNQRLHAKSQSNIMDFLKSYDMNELRSLTFNIHPGLGQKWALPTNFLKLTSCANLAVLKLLGTHVPGLPHLPALRHLVLMGTSISFSHFQDFLSSTSSIERLHMKWVMFSFETTPEPGNVPRIHLPALQNISIVETYERAALLVGMLSAPQNSLHILITDSMKDSATRPYRNIIAEGLARFQLARGGDACTLPTLMVTRTVKDQFRAIWTTAIFGGPSLFYSRPVACAEPDDPVWADVTTVHLVYTLGYPGHDLVARDTDIDLRVLRRADALVVIGAGLDPEADEVGMRSLEDWLVSRYDDGRPFHSVEFCQCGDAARMLFERLEAGGVAGAVVWVP
jgi:hypothetical protein